MAGMLDFIPLKISPERYEIETSEPYNIRRYKDTAGNDIPVEKRRNIKKTKSKVDGYVRVTIDGKTIAMHVVMACQMFEGITLQHLKDNRLVVDHLDNDKSNNSPANLRVCTQQENCERIVRNNPKAGEKAERNKRFEITYDELVSNYVFVLNGCDGSDIENVEDITNHYYSDIRDFKKIIKVYGIGASGDGTYVARECRFDPEVSLFSLTIGKEKGNKRVTTRSINWLIHTNFTLRDIVAGVLNDTFDDMIKEFNGERQYVESSSYISLISEKLNSVTPNLSVSHDDITRLTNGRLHYKSDIVYVRGQKMLNDAGEILSKARIGGRHNSSDSKDVIKNIAALLKERYGIKKNNNQLALSLYEFCCATVK